jgi:UDP-N-acetylglucosamine diphosphorylase / glucose-1-phosphate thymidylyltransferase / UDP-N-acetylgalactosamine diphosphorylase / glucosamine-1-phosphate N-acetyltransferase / galactosamine-1-phosphate N-acetyltransferase
MPETTLANFVRDLSRLPGRPPDGRPWQLIGQVEALVRAALGTLGDEFDLIGPEIAAHRTATVASSAELTGPVILGPGCRVGPGAVLRGGVWADQDVTIGPHSEIKASLVFAGSAAAHRN